VFVGLLKDFHVVGQEKEKFYTIEQIPAVAKAMDSLAGTSPSI